VPKRKIHFIGFLANADCSILKVWLEHGFEFASMKYKDATSLISELEREVVRFGLGTAGFPSACLEMSTLACYYVRKSFDCELKEGAEWKPGGFPDAAGKADTTIVRPYLIRKIRLMRLFKEGNICVPLHY